MTLLPSDTLGATLGAIDSAWGAGAAGVGVGTVAMTGRATLATAGAAGDAVTQAGSGAGLGPASFTRIPLASTWRYQTSERLAPPGVVPERMSWWTSAGMLVGKLPTTVKLPSPDAAALPIWVGVEWNSRVTVLLARAPAPVMLIDLPESGDPIEGSCASTETVLAVVLEADDAAPGTLAGEAGRSDGHAVGGRGAQALELEAAPAELAAAAERAAVELHHVAGDAEAAVAARRHHGSDVSCALMRPTLREGSPGSAAGVASAAGVEASELPTRFVATTEME